MLSKEKIEKGLCGVETFVFEEIDSTNSEAKRRATHGGVLPVLVLAEGQSAGRGRLGRSFYSPEGAGLYMSLAYKVRGELSDAVTITSAAAVAVSLSLQELCHIDSGIKWVNDIYVDGRKVCGILAEAVSCGEENVIVVGIGINCTTKVFPDEIKDRAGSVGKVDRNALAVDIVKRILSYAENIEKREWMAEYRRRSLVTGREISYTEKDVTKKARAVDIDNNGGLVINENGVIKTLSTGEITVRY